MLVAEAPAAAFGDPNALARNRQVPQEQFAVVGLELVDKRPDRDRDDQVLGAAAGLVGGRPRLARLGRKLLLETELDQGRKFGRRLQNDVTPAPAVAAGRTALGHVFLAPPGDDPVTPGAARDRDRRLVDELHG